MIQITKHNTAPTFNIGNGVATLDINNGNENGRAMQIQSDGKILVAGTTGTGSATKLLLTRYNVDGSLDSSFGAGKGYVNVAGITHLGNEIAIQADGKILVNGWNNPNSSVRDQVVLRFNSDGSFDTKFPLLSTNGDNLANENAGVIILSNGDFAFADSYQYSNGETHVRYGQRTLNGALRGISSEFKDFKSSDIFSDNDGGFYVVGNSQTGTTGRVLHVNNKITSNNGHPGTQDFSLGSNATSLYAGALNKDGNIVLAGTENGNLVVYALNPANSIVKTIASKDLGGIDVVRSVVIQDDGKIIVAGYSMQAQSMQISLLRYLPDGTLDTSFDQDGIVTTTIGSHAQGFAVLLQTDGKILITGKAVNGHGDDLIVLRYNHDGSVDTHFAANTNTLDAAPVRFIQYGNAAVMDGDIQLYDADLAGLNMQAGNYAGSSLKLERHSGPNKSDLFSGAGINPGQATGDVSVDAKVIGSYSYDNGSLTINFNSNATQTRVDTALRSLAYQNNADFPEKDVAIDWIFNDGNGSAQSYDKALSVIATKNITIVRAPHVDLNGALTGNNFDTTYTLVVDPAKPVNPAVAISAKDMSVTDLEHNYLESATITINNYHAGTTVNGKTLAGDTVNFSQSFPWKNVTKTESVDIKANTKTITLLNPYGHGGSPDLVSTQLATWKEILGGITFNTDILNTDDRKVTITVYDGVTTSAPAISTVSVKVAGNVPHTGVVTVSGEYKQNATLTASNTIKDLNGIAEGAIQYQWNTVVMNGDIPVRTAISGATSATFTLTEAQVNKSIDVVATYKDNAGVTESQASVISSKIINVNDAPAGKPLVSGKLAQFQILSADISKISDPDGLPAVKDFSYQWKANGVAILNANSKTFVLTEAQVDKQISVDVKYTDNHNTKETVISEMTNIVANVNDQVTGAVTINGDFSVEGKIEADTSSLVDVDGLGTLHYQWFANNQLIKNAADNPAYTLTNAEIGKTISVAVRYVDGHGTTEQLKSEASEAVQLFSTGMLKFSDGIVWSKNPNGSYSVKGDFSVGPIDVKNGSATVTPSSKNGTPDFEDTGAIEIKGSLSTTIPGYTLQLGQSSLLVKDWNDGVADYSGNVSLSGVQIPLSRLVFKDDNAEIGVGTFKLPTGSKNFLSIDTSATKVNLAITPDNVMLTTAAGRYFSIRDQKISVKGLELETHAVKVSYDALENKFVLLGGLKIDVPGDFPALEFELAESEEEDEEGGLVIQNGEITKLTLTTSIDDFEIGKFAVKDTKVSLVLGTQNDSFSAEGELTIPFGEKEISLGAEIGLTLNPAKLDKIKLNVGLPKPIPIGTTGASIDSLGGGLANLAAQTNNQPVLFSGTVGMYFGTPIFAPTDEDPEATKLPDHFDFTAEVDKNHIAGKFEGWILDKKLMQLDGYAEVYWKASKDHIAGFGFAANANILDGTLRAHLDIQSDFNLNFDAHGSAYFKIPGINIEANGNFHLHYTNNGNSSDDYVALWTSIHIHIDTPWHWFDIDYDITVGAKVNLNGSGFTIFGAEGIALYGSWVVDTRLLKDLSVMMTWEKPVTDFHEVKLKFTAYQKIEGLTAEQNETAEYKLIEIKEADFAKYGITVVDKLSDRTHKFVVVAEGFNNALADKAFTDAYGIRLMELGNYIYDIEIDTTPYDLGAVDKSATTSLKENALEIKAVSFNADQLQIDFNAISAAETAEIQFYIDTSNVAVGEAQAGQPLPENYHALFNGKSIGKALTLNKNAPFDQHLDLDTSSLPGGTYWVYGVLSDGKSIPKMVYAGNSISIAGNADAQITLETVKAVPGVDFEVTLNLSNSGLRTAKNLDIKASLPAGMVLVKSSLDTYIPTSENSVVMPDAGDQDGVHFKLDSLAVGASQKIILTVRSETDAYYEIKTLVSSVSADENLANNAASLNLVVGTPNAKPVGSANGALANQKENTPFILKSADLLLGFSDPDHDAISVVSLSSRHATVVDNGNATWTVTPETNYSGKLILSYSVVDGKGGNISAMQSLTLLENQPHPIVYAQDVTLNETNAPVLINGKLEVHDYVGQIDFVAQPNTGGKYGVFSVQTDGSWAYKAKLAYDYLNPGETLSEQFQVKLTDGTASLVTVHIAGTAETGSVHLGDAPASQSSSGAEWSKAWTQSGYNIEHKADAGNLTEAWSSVTLSSVSPQQMSGGDVFSGNLGVSGQSAKTSTTKQEIDGNEVLRISLPANVTADTVSLKLSNLFANDDASSFSESGIVRLFNAKGVQVGEQIFVAKEADGLLNLSVTANTAFSSLQLMAGAYDADHHFIGGAYSLANGNFGSAIATDTAGKTHGSEFLLHAVDFSVTVVGVPAV